MDNTSTLQYLVDIQEICLNMAKEVHDSDISMNKQKLAHMFKKANSIRDMAKYIVAAQNAQQSKELFLFCCY